MLYSLYKTQSNNSENDNNNKNVQERSSYSTQTTEIGSDTIKHQVKIILNSFDLYVQIVVGIGYLS